VMEGTGGARQRRRVNGFRSRKDRDDSAHVRYSLKKVKS
jgi:hypothetical protein